MYFLSAKNTISSGTVTSVVAANCKLYTGLASDPVPTVKLVDLSATEINQFFFSEATNCGQIYAFHEPIADKITMVIIVGLATGSITLNKYLKSEQPSTRAAWYSEFGICLNVCLKKKI